MERLSSAKASYDAFIARKTVLMNEAVPVFEWDYTTTSMAFAVDVLAGVSLTRNAWYLLNKAIFRRPPSEIHVVGGDLNSDESKTLVTGGLGFVGSKIVKRLVDGGRKVVVFDLRLPEQPLPSVVYVKGALQNKNHVSHVLNEFTNIDSVLHVAALLGPLGVTDSDLQAVNVDGTKHVLDCALQSKTVKSFLLTSSAAAVTSADSMGVLQAGREEDLPSPINFIEPYGKSKALQEELAFNPKYSSLNVAALRPSIIYGVGDKKLVDQLLKGKDNVVLGSGNTLMDFIDVDSVVDAHVKCLKVLSASAGNGTFLDGSTTPQAFAIGSGIGVSLNEFYNGWCPSKPMHVPVFVAKLAAHFNRAVWVLFKYAPLSIWLYPESVDILTTPWYFDTSKARSAFGYTPDKLENVKRKLVNSR